MDWGKHVVLRTLEGAVEYPGVQLQFLLQRLEACPQAMPATADAIEDMGEWHQAHADAMRAAARRKGGAEIIRLEK